jgi:hypothetical protein
MGPHEIDIAPPPSALDTDIAAFGPGPGPQAAAETPRPPTAPADLRFAPSSRSSEYLPADLTEFQRV